MVKIGLTRRLEPMDRVRELGDASVPFQFDVHALIFSEDAVSLETSLHKAFEERKVNRVNSRREFFYATPHEVRDVLATMETEVLLEFHEQPEAFEWRASGGADRSKSLTPSILETRVDEPDNPRMPALPAIPESLVTSDVNASTPEPEDSDPTPAVTPVSERPSGTTTATQEVSPEPSPSQVTTSPSANWYPDPKGQSRLRYWDGQQWTDHTAD